MLGRRAALALTVSAVLLVATACTRSSSAHEEGRVPTVAVTTNILADVTAAIGGDAIEVIDLMPPGADPHGLALSAAEAERLLDADLVIANGLGLEEGLVDVLAAARREGVPVLEVGPALDPLGYAGTVAARGPDLDPHVWTDPRRMATASDLIGDHLAELVTDAAADDVRGRQEDYRRRLEALDSEIEDMVGTIPPERRRLVTNHHVFGYFADRYGFEVLGAVIPSGSTLASPSARDLADLTTVLRTSDVRAIFAETSQPTRLAEVLAVESGLDIDVVSLHTESLGPPGSSADSYLGMMRTNAESITAALVS
ncbi:metal ABC transporter substrate-binding protein [Actinomarinicola tropica]|uniref:metal ABC transporter substrate-binding protein n=1 Tax=Actinomarinicola tropica TaxID=2789776 RepID=UPI00189C33A6|nr:metal ABC transporter substrate-binding protein [Actinomarinicola tropica]